MSLSSPKNSLAVGVGIGPFTSIAAEKSCAKFLHECGYVGVRDSKSLEIAQSIAPKANINKTFDLAPLLLCTKKYKPQKSERKGIAFTLCSVGLNAMGKTDKNAEQQRIKQFTQLMTQLFQKTGEPITLIEFNGHSSLGDWKINNNIVDRLSKTIPVTIKKYDPNPIALLENLSSYKAILSMRLHGAILGYLANTPVLSVNYHSKCRGWCDEIGMNADYQIDLSNLDIEQIVTQIVKGLSTSFIPPTLPVDTAIKNSLSNWSIQNEQHKFYRHYSTV
jgi:polysaccharide pyruvyl transferase WcaK-like protein